MNRIALVIVLTIILVVGSLSAQDVDVSRLRQAALDNTFGARPAGNSFGLIDFSKLNFSHSYSLTFLSGGGASGNVGTWNTSMFYELSPKLSMALDLSVMHTGGALSSPGQQSATVLPGFMLDYHPSKNFSISIGMSRVNPYYSTNRFQSTGFGNRNVWWPSR